MLLCRLDDAESMLEASARLHRLAVAAHSPHMYLMKATLGNYYRDTDRPLEAVALLEEVVSHMGRSLHYVQ